MRHWAFLLHLPFSLSIRLHITLHFLISYYPSLALFHSVPSFLSSFHHPTAHGCPSLGLVLLEELLLLTVTKRLLMCLHIAPTQRITSSFICGHLQFQTTKNPHAKTLRLWDVPRSQLLMSCCSLWDIPIIIWWERRRTENQTWHILLPFLNLQLWRI